VVGKDMPCNPENSKDIQQISPVRVRGGSGLTGLFKPISALFPFISWTQDLFRGQLLDLLFWPKGAESIGPNLAH
jgi:hypothetical protein